jgi:hypothetical protein
MLLLLALPAMLGLNDHDEEDEKDEPRLLSNGMASDADMNRYDWETGKFVPEGARVYRTGCGWNDHQHGCPVCEAEGDRIRIVDGGSPGQSQNR